MATRSRTAQVVDKYIDNDTKTQAMREMRENRYSDEAVMAKAPAEPHMTEVLQYVHESIQCLFDEISSIREKAFPVMRDSHPEDTTAGFVGFPGESEIKNQVGNFGHEIRRATDELASIRRRLDV